MNKYQFFSDWSIEASSPQQEPQPPQQRSPPQRPLPQPPAKDSGQRSVERASHNFGGVIAELKSTNVDKTVKSPPQQPPLLPQPRPQGPPLSQGKSRPQWRLRPPPPWRRPRSPKQGVRSVSEWFFGSFSLILILIHSLVYIHSLPHSPPPRRAPLWRLPPRQPPPRRRSLKITTNHRSKDWQENNSQKWAPGRLGALCRPLC